MNDFNRNWLLHGKRNLFTWDESPTWIHDNELIRGSFRPSGKRDKIASLRSIFALHNETTNIWTHLVFGFILQVGVFYHLFDVTLPAIQPPMRSGDWYMWYAFAAGSIACMGFSATFHIFMNFSHDSISAPRRPRLQWHRGTEYDTVSIDTLSTRVPAENTGRGHVDIGLRVPCRACGRSRAQAHDARIPLVSHYSFHCTRGDGVGAYYRLWRVHRTGMYLLLAHLLVDVEIRRMLPYRSVYLREALSRGVLPRWGKTRRLQRLGTFAHADAHLCHHGHYFLRLRLPGSASLFAKRCVHLPGCLIFINKIENF